MRVFFVRLMLVAVIMVMVMVMVVGVERRTLGSSLVMSCVKRVGVECSTFQCERMVSQKPLA